MTSLGTELPQRATLAWALVGFAVVLSVPTLAVLRRAAVSGGAGTWATGAALALLLVIGPALLAWNLKRIHVFVDESTVTRARGDEVAHRVDLDTLTEVRYKREGYYMTITMVGADPEGRPVRFPVSGVYVSDLGPLAERLEPRLREQPELLADEFERRWWEKDFGPLAR